LEREIQLDIKRDPAAILARLQDLAIEDLMQTSDEELLAEAIEDGEDVDALAAEMRERLLRRIAEYPK
jgi:hypothetical protein